MEGRGSLNSEDRKSLERFCVTILAKKQTPDDRLPLSELQQSTITSNMLQLAQLLSSSCDLQSDDFSAAARRCCFTEVQRQQLQSVADRTDRTGKLLDMLCRRSCGDVRRLAQNICSEGQSELADLLLHGGGTKSNKVPVVTLLFFRVSGNNGCGA